VITVEPVVLEGALVRLEPLSEHHAAGLAKHGEDEIFRFFGAIRPQHNDPQDASEFVRRMNDMPGVVPFAIVLKETGETIGCTTYMDIRPQHDGLEIGMTWIGRAHQRTGVNTECKLLLLTHAFEKIGCARVQLKTDLRNVQSQAAIERIGGVKEGVLRKHMIMPDGFLRETVMYSIISSEWPECKARLEAMRERAGVRNS
jgi:RimJ/RimL family protein N-acetyltransferase